MRRLRCDRSAAAIWAEAELASPAQGDSPCDELFASPHFAAAKTRNYDWKISGRNDADMAFFNASARDDLLVSETSRRTHKRLTYFQRTQNHDAGQCVNRCAR